MYFFLSTSPKTEQISNQWVYYFSMYLKLAIMWNIWRVDEIFSRAYDTWTCAWNICVTCARAVTTTCFIPQGRTPSYPSQWSPYPGLIDFPFSIEVSLFTNLWKQLQKKLRQEIYTLYKNMEQISCVEDQVVPANDEKELKMCIKSDINFSIRATFTQTRNYWKFKI